MPGPIYKDSWSSTPPPSIYDIVRNPQAMHKASVKQVSSTKDILESTHQRLNREIMEKWHSNAFRLPHDTFIVVARVGKFLFLAIMLPPYIFFYGMPKWILQFVLPNIILIAKNESLKVGRYFTTISKHVIDLMKGLLKQTIGDSLKILNQRARNFFKLAKKQINSFKKLVIQKCQKALQSVLNPIIAFQNRVQAIYQKNLTIVKEKINQQKVYFKKLYERGRSLMKAVLQPIYKHTLLPIVQWSKPKISYVKDRVRATKEYLNKKTKEISEAISNQVNFLVVKTTQIIKEVTQTALAIVNPVVQPIIQKVASPLAAVKSFVQEKASENIQHVLNKVRIFQEKIERIATESFEFIESVIIEVAELFLPFKKWFNKKREQGQTFKKAIGMTAKKFIANISKINEQVGDWLTRLLQLIKRSLISLKEQCLLIHKKIGYFLIKTLKFSILAINKTIYAFQWSAIFGWVLFKYGMFLVHELATDIGNFVVGYTESPKS